MTTTPMTPNDSLNQDKKNNVYQMFLTVIMLLIKSYTVFYLWE